MTSETTTFEFVRTNMARTPFHQWLEPRLIAVDEEAGTITVDLTLRHEFRRLPDLPGVHGGILAALVDITGHATIAAKLRHSVATIDMRVDYLRLAGGAELRAVGTVVKIGRTIGIADIKISDDAGKAVAIGRASYLCASV